ncbi:MAG: hypothetical protein QOK15_1786 [Nocardioidaceae bacterium]|nr:hypothetical protein [Nocardioidaceae bacterium]
MTKRLLCVHVGASKTGTSALQRGLRDSQEMLRAAGIGSPFPGRHSSVRRLLWPMGWVAGSGFVRPVEPTVVDDLAAAMRNTSGERLLISNEDLCEMDPTRISLFLRAAAAADLDVVVVLTGRDWGKQLPSEWQQFLKHRLTVAYPAFLEQVRHREGAAAEHFWVRQDYAGICRRWGASLDPARVHVIPVPSMAQDPEGVFRSFGDVVGFDGTSLTRPRRAVNPSFGYVEAEVLRRLNLALGTRLPDYEVEYAPAVRRVLVKQVLARESSGRITLPPEHLDWVRELDQQRVDDLLARGYRVHGDPKLLVTPADSGRPLPLLDEGAIATAAVETLANFVVRSFRDRTEGVPADDDV